MLSDKPESPGEGRSSVLSVRVENETLDGFRRCVEAEGGTVSGSLRDAIESLLDGARRRENDGLDVGQRILTQNHELDVAGDVLDDTEELSVADETPPAGDVLDDTEELSVADETPPAGDVAETVAQVGLGFSLGVFLARVLGLLR